MKIIIIDSGFSICGRNIEHLNTLDGIAIEKKDGQYLFNDNFEDRIGHGTVVANILLKHLSNDIDLFIIKIYESQLIADVDTLTEALKYCEKINCDLIQISLGSLYSDENLFSVINSLCSKGVTIISAFDNDKCISYPAAYKSVIGVDITHDYKSIEQYDIIETNVIDIRGADIYHRVCGIGNKNIIVRGSSFYCSYITAQIINSNLSPLNKENVLDMLKKSAQKIIGQHIPVITKHLDIKKAVVFPFNKEVKSMAAFERMLYFDVLGYYDLRQKGLIDRQIYNVLPFTNNKKTIHNFDKLNWNDDFDTFICGHIGEINKLLGYDVFEKIIYNCDKYGKQLVCFDNISNYLRDYPNVLAWFPYVDSKIVPKHRFGKLRSPNIPIIGVFGTSSKQGKMTIQLRLREVLLKRGIKIGSIGSEPESLLFGFEKAYVFGYESTDLLSPTEMIQVLNEYVYELEKSDYKIIVAGSQSGTVPHQLRNTSMIPLRQYYFLLGTQPDSIILCVNDFDSFEYIHRTISFFKSTVMANVICLVVSSINSPVDNSERKSSEAFMSEFGIPAFDLKSFCDDDIVNEILNYYNESG